MYPSWGWLHAAGLPGRHCQFALDLWELRELDVSETEESARPNAN